MGKKVPELGYMLLKNCNINRDETIESTFVEIYLHAKVQNRLIRRM